MGEWDESRKQKLCMIINAINVCEERQGEREICFFALHATFDAQCCFRNGVVVKEVGTGVGGG